MLPHLPSAGILANYIQKDIEELLLLVIMGLMHRAGWSM
jgi:hypothetical protein